MLHPVGRPQVSVAVNLAVDGTGALYVLGWVTDQIVAAQKRSF
jgi:hypothetical protein